jgi:hypothetical protein
MLPRVEGRGVVALKKSNYKDYYDNNKWRQQGNYHYNKATTRQQQNYELLGLGATNYY